MKRYLICLCFVGCAYTIKFEPLPVVLSWGGITPDKNLVSKTKALPEDPPNFVQVDPNIYRGGEPGLAGWSELCLKGVKSEIKLDFPDEGDPVKPICDTTTVATPLPPKDLWEVVTEPTQQQLMQIQQNIEAAKPPVYIHCLHGDDRTGLVVGMYRVLHDHWTPTQAYAEMKKLGYHTELIGLDRAWHAFADHQPPTKAP